MHINGQTDSRQTKTKTHTSTRHSRLQALLEAAVTAGVARARVDDAISAQFAIVDRAFDQAATKEFLQHMHNSAQHYYRAAGNRQTKQMKTDYVHSNKQVATTTCSDSTKIIPYI